ncbi:MAG: HAD-IIB family hydrolase [bacterium]|nr:HAD-IIB family hydrolase [bacterium]
MRYKALICDVDGTLMLNKIDGLPSKRVTRAINQAKKLLHVGIASARPFIQADYLFNHLKLKGPSIVLGGSLIIDAHSKKTLNEKALSKNEFIQICSILKKLKLPFYVNERNKQTLYFKNFQPSSNLLDVYVPKLSELIASALEKQFSNLVSLGIHKATDWENNMLAVGIRSIKADKEHGVHEIARLLNIKTDEIIGVGDGHNDISLLAACGLKIAMGNAIPEIKTMADYIAPSVEEDGLAHVIERFILKNTSE